MTPTSYSALFLWVVLGPVGLWVGASARYALATKVGARAGPILSTGVVLALLAGASSVATANAEIWYDPVAGWSVVMVSFFVPFVSASLTKNRWLLILSIPVAGFLSVFTVWIFEALSIGSRGGGA